MDANKPIGGAGGLEAPCENAHIHSYLNYYLDMAYPLYYAVMISGDWGVGKTHLIKTKIKSAVNGIPCSYVSLYGLGSIDDIDAAILQTLHPALASTGAKVAGRLGRTALKYLKIDSAFGAGDILSAAGGSRVYVFDDLERCSLGLNQVLGYINELVEHDGHKVIIIANEGELTLRDQQYVKVREKLVGKTLEVQPAIDSALREFSSKVSSKNARAAIDGNFELIKEIFGRASRRNFRILQQTIWDFERLACCLSDRHFECHEGISRIISLLFVFSVEFRAGVISKEDISQRPSRMVKLFRQQRESSDKTKLDLVDEQFPNVDVLDQILNDNVLLDILSKGLFDSQSILESVNRDRVYCLVEDEPCWVTVWHAMDRDECDFDAALCEMERQFEAREILEVGVILHVVGLRLWLAGLGVLNCSRGKVIEQAKQYVEDLYAKKALSPCTHIDNDLARYEGYAGLGVHEAKEPDFCEFNNFLGQMRRKVFVESYPEKAKALIEEMMSDVDLFRRRTSWSDGSENTYANVPVLSCISPAEFVGKVVSLKGENRRRVIYALAARYSKGSLERDLAEEKSWLSEVREEFLKKLVSESPITRWGMTGALNYYIDPLLDGADSGV